MMQRIYNLSEDASHNIEYCLENAIKLSMAYIKNSFFSGQVPIT